MDSKSHCRQDGYQKGFCDGRRTGGKIRKAYIDNFFKDETASLSTEDSLEFTKGWQEGFTDGVSRVINHMMQKEGLLISQIHEVG